MEERILSFEEFSKLENLCRNLVQNPKDLELLSRLKAITENSPKSFIQVVQPKILAYFYVFSNIYVKDKTSFSLSQKQLIIETFRILFEKSVIDKIGVFLSVYSFLLFEIYNHEQNKVLPVPEEYKLSVLKCTKALAGAISSELIFELYTRANAPKLSQMLLAALIIAKNEQLISLRVTAIECIMSLARILDDEHFNDIVVRKQVAEMFQLFLPGVVCSLKLIALEDEKNSHRIPLIALRAWGRIVTLLMQDYDASNRIPNISELKERITNSSDYETPKTQWSDKKELNEHIQNMKFTPQWYNYTDKNLNKLVPDFMELTHHHHHKVRLELAEMCEVIIENCLGTMPLSSSHLIEILMTLTEDEDNSISIKSREILKNLSNRLSSDNLKTLFENLEEGFITGIDSLPRQFNGIDERKQLSSLNLLIGYLNLFGQHKLNHVLLTANRLDKLLATLIHISELEKSTTGLMEEYSLKNLEQSPNSKYPWKKFTHFNDDSVRLKLEKLCGLLGSFESFRMVSDFLHETIVDDRAQRKEAVFILNGVITGVNSEKDNIDIITDIIDTYTDSRYWEVPITVATDEYGYEPTLAEVQHNAVQVSLLVEGIGKIASILKDDFKRFILKTLYIILEKAGSTHSLVRSAGFSALGNVTQACGYSDITDLVTKNIDYFTYHVERKLNKAENKENVLSVFSVVLKYSTVDMLQYLSYPIQEVLVLSCDRYKATDINSYLEVFKILMKSLKRWFNIEIKEEPFKSRAEKLKEYENFRVTGADQVTDDFSDDIMGKTAQELYEEDKKKRQEMEEMDSDDEPEPGEPVKPNPSLEVKLAVAVLQRSLNFLPSKDRLRKLLVLEILSDGLEVIRDWEDELLPIVHQIWSPLVQRFKEHDDPVVVNFSFQLLVTLSRLSKDFIRMRTVKQALPSILELLEKLARNSYRKDKGSAYRYSPAFKLQSVILENLATILINLDAEDTTMNKVILCVCSYLSSLQPIPLQVAAIKCFKLLSKFDPVVLKQLESWEHKQNSEFEKNCSEIISYISEINVNKS